MSKRFGNVLIINMSRLGDFVSSFVVINAMKEVADNIDIICKPAYQDIVHNEEALNAISVELAKNKEYDVMLDLTSDSETRRIAKSITANIKVGAYGTLFRKLRYKLLGVFTHSFKVRPYGNIVKDYFPYSETIGVQSQSIPSLNRLDVPDLVSLYGIKEKGPVIGVHISGTDKTRHLPVALIQDIARYTNDIGGAMVMLGDEKGANQVGLDLPGVYYREESITELIAIVSQLDYLVAPDSGVLHLASSLGTASLGVYGVNLVSVSGPPGESVDFIELELDCRPCDYINTCPYNVRCMNDIKFSDIKEFLDNKLLNM